MAYQHIIHLENGRLADDSPPEDVANIVTKAVKSESSGGIAIHFHGGLISHERGLEIANKLQPKYQSAGAYPVFFVWESGLFETLEGRVQDIAKEKLFRIIYKRVRKIAKRKFKQTSGERGSGTLPTVNTADEEKAIDAAFESLDSSMMPPDEPGPDLSSDLTSKERRSLEAELQQDLALSQAIKEVSAGLMAEGEAEVTITSRAPMTRISAATMMDPAAIERLMDEKVEGSRGLLSTVKFIKAMVFIAAKVIKRFAIDRDHGLHATVVEEILREFYAANLGRAIWSEMKSNTAESFGPDELSHGGTAFISSLMKVLESQSEVPKITLIGHSTGAVYISHFLNAVNEMGAYDSIKFDVIFLAPASTFRLTAQTLRNHGNRIANFRMFTMTDENEKKDKLVPVVYPHSLLYFVSGVVEDNIDEPIVGMQRFYLDSAFPDKKFPNIAAVRKYLTDDPNRAVWSVESRGDGLASRALKHGDFDDDNVTIDSIKHILGVGF